MRIFGIKHLAIIIFISCLSIKLATSAIPASRGHFNQTLMGGGCDYNCARCFDGKVCLSCYSGYYLNSGYCFTCNTGCYSCSSFSSCSSCKSGYYISNGYCYLDSSSTTFSNTVSLVFLVFFFIYCVVLCKKLHKKKNKGPLYVESGDFPSQPEGFQSLSHPQFNNQSLPYQPTPNFIPPHHPQIHNDGYFYPPQIHQQHYDNNSHQNYPPLPQTS